MPESLDARAKSIIDEMGDLEEPQRNEVLKRSCAGDSNLLHRVESLLAAMARDDGFLREPTVLLAPSNDKSTLGESPGGCIGPYKLIELLGEGGFGSVYLAEQSQPVRRQVALKIIKLGMDTRQVIARFEAERQALALMDHHCIARVIDAGSTDGGRPYFVMDLVRGELITEYCDRERLSIRERLELFRQVCGAVQHAHQKGIIHRDIKPSNVLITVVDGRAIPKVIDFGIAKATAGRLTDATLHTEMHQLIGTPDYMSPEQADPSCADIDTRSDLYSLGVLLYELLTGSTPYDRQRLRSASFAEMQRIIREEEAPRPSARLATLASSSAFSPMPSPAGAARAKPPSSMIEIAECRRTEPLPLTRAIQGDLDWIVLKCLEKDRSRRYETASALADDISRHLSHEPVTAIPPNRSYRFRKFMRRNRKGVLAGAAISVAILLGITGISVGLVRARKGQLEAKARADELEKVAKFQEAQLSGIDASVMGMGLRAELLGKARAAAEQSKVAPNEIDVRINELEKLIAGSDFTGMAIESLDNNFFKPALAAIHTQFADQPLVQARLLQTSASTLRELGMLDATSGPQEEALAIRRRELGDEHPDTLTSCSEMGLLLYARGKYTDAEPFCRDALGRRRRVLGEDHPDTLQSLHDLAELLQVQGRMSEAEQYYRDVLDRRRRVLGDEHPSVLISIGQLGNLLSAQDKLAEAEPYCRDAFEKFRRIKGEDHRDTIAAMNNLGAVLYSQRKLAEAEPYYRGALEKCRRAFGDTHPYTLSTITNLAVLLSSQRKLTEADGYYREILGTSRRILGDEHPLTLTAIYNLGVSLRDQEKFLEAEPYFREALEKQRRILSNDHPNTLLSIMQTGSLLYDEGKYAESEPYFREALESGRRVLGEKHSRTISSMTSLGRALRAQGKATEAIGLLAPAESAARKAFAGNYIHRLGRYLTVLGHSRAEIGEFEAADKNLNEAYSILSGSTASTQQDRIEVLTGLAVLYEAWEKAEPGKGRDVEAAKWREALVQIHSQEDK